MKDLVRIIVRCLIKLIVLKEFVGIIVRNLIDLRAERCLFPEL